MSILFVWDNNKNIQWHVFTRHFLTQLIFKIRAVLVVPFPLFCVYMISYLSKRFDNGHANGRYSRGAALSENLKLKS